MQSQKNCPIGTLYRPCERQEGAMRFYFVCLFAGEQEGFLFCRGCDDQADLTGFVDGITGNEMWMYSFERCFQKCIAVFVTYV